MFPRDRQPELMDDPALPEDQHRHALSGLARLNRFSGVASAMYSRLAQYFDTQNGCLRLLDVACGSGDLPIAWAKRAKREGVPLQITTVDISELAAEEQRRRAADAGVEIETLVLDCLHQPLPTGFDVVTCSLFMHHLEPRDVTRLLQSMQAATEGALLVCDLDRAMHNLAMVTVASRLLTRSRVVHVDAARSIRAAYTRSEFKQIAEDALLRPVKVQRLFPCRFIASVDDRTVPLVSPAFA